MTTEAGARAVLSANISAAVRCTDAHRRHVVDFSTVPALWLLFAASVCSRQCYARSASVLNIED